MIKRIKLLLNLFIVLAAGAGVMGCGKSGPGDTAEDSYSKSLDQALEKQKAISEKVRNLAAKRQELGKQLVDRTGGDKPEEIETSPAAPQVTEEAFFQTAASGKWDMAAITAAAKASASRNTPLHLAVALGDAAIVEDLCKQGADVNAKNRDGDTPLIFAVKQKFHEHTANREERLNQIIETALMTLVGKYSADIDAKNNGGKTAADLATAEFAQILRTPDLRNKIHDAATAVEAAKSEKCENNLKNIGLAFRFFATDNGDRFPFNVSTNDGGSMEFRRAGIQGYDANAFRHFQVMSNELSTPKILICPADAKKHEATNWSELRDQHVSYDLRSNPDLDESKPHEVLVRCAIHGHVMLCDGSVQATPRPASAASGPAARRDSSSPEEQVKNCIQNLRMIEGAKEQWALENKKTTGASTTGADIAIAAFIRGGMIPVCPGGGAYTLGRVGEAPRCTFEASGHTLAVVPQNTTQDRVAPERAVGDDPMTLTMKDGTTLTGNFQASRVNFKTTYGNVEVNTSEIVSLQDGFLKLTDGSSLRGTFGDGKTSFRTIRGLLDLPSGEITQIGRASGTQPQSAKPAQPPRPEQSTTHSQASFSIPEGASAHEIVRIAIKAKGGEETLAKRTSLHETGAGRTFTPAGEIPFAFEQYFKHPNQVREEMTFQSGGQKFTHVSIFDGRIGWKSVNGKTQKQDSSDLKTQDERLYLIEILGLTCLLNPPYVLNRESDTSTGDVPLAVVKISAKGRSDMYLHLDKNSAFVVRTQATARAGASEQKGLVTEEFVFSDFREIDGVIVPMRTTLYKNGTKSAESEIKEIRFVDNLHENLFHQIQIGSESAGVAPVKSDISGRYVAEGRGSPITGRDFVYLGRTIELPDGPHGKLRLGNLGQTLDFEYRIQGETVSVRWSEQDQWHEAFSLNGGVLTSKADGLPLVSSRKFVKEGVPVRSPTPSRADPGPADENGSKESQSFDRALRDWGSTDAGETHVWRAEAELTKARDALMRAINTGANKWRVSQESTPEVGTTILRLVAKQVIGTPRRALIQLSQLPGNTIEVRAKIAVGSGAGASSPRQSDLQSRLPVEIKSNLERELGVSLTETR
jgi:hypothetical protein